MLGCCCPVFCTVGRACFFQEDDSDLDEKTSADSSSDSGDSDFSSDLYSLALNETGPEMVVLGTLRKVCVVCRALCLRGVLCFGISWPVATGIDRVKFWIGTRAVCSPCL